MLALLCVLCSAYGLNDIDKTAAVLATIMVVGQILDQLTEYLVPWAIDRTQRVRARDALLGNTNEEDDEEAGHGKGLLQDNDNPGTQEVRHAYTSFHAIVGATIQEDVWYALAPALTLFPCCYAQVTEEDPQSIATRKEIMGKEVYVSIELADMVIQFGYIALFGFTWPLAALAVLVNNFMAVRLDVWKFCTLSRRPLAQRSRGLGALWSVVLEAVAVAGIINTCFVLAMCTTTMSEYFFPEIDTYKRAVAAFATETVFLLAYALVRLLYLHVAPKWVVASKKEPLRFLRDAYRAGCALRERRFVSCLQFSLTAPPPPPPPSAGPGQQGEGIAHPPSNSYACVGHRSFVRSFVRLLLGGGTEVLLLLLFRTDTSCSMPLQMPRMSLYRWSPRKRRWRRPPLCPT